MKIKISILSLFMVFAFFTASAQTKTPKITKTQFYQQKKIKQGIKSGELTKQEVRQLQGQQLRIQKTKKRAKSDGKVTPKEKAVIRLRQKKANATIYRQKNDRQDRN